MIDGPTSASSKRRSRRRRRHTPPGSAPGTLVADPHGATPVIRAIAYGADDLVEEDVTDLERLDALRRAHPVLWVNVDGLGDADVIERLGHMFGLHPLALEDVLHVEQRPKVEDYDSHLFVVTRMPHLAPRFESEQLAIFLGTGFVLTFQERQGDCLDAVRNRLRGRKGRIRAQGADYLVYAILDAVIDAFFPMLEAYGEQVETIEDNVLGSYDSRIVHEIHRMKHDLLMVRRAIWPQREMISTMIRDECDLVSEQTRVYLRDCYDHTIQLVDMTETYREVAADLVDIYLSRQGQHMNEIMKVLTIIATIFIPLSFVAGVYGMNFDRAASPWNMPELGWTFGYPMALGLMAAIAAALLVYFWRKGWIGGGRRD